MPVHLERQGVHTDTTGVEGNCCARETISRLPDEKDMTSLCADKCKVSSNYKGFICCFVFQIKHILDLFKYLNLFSILALCEQQLNLLVGIKVINRHCVLHGIYRKIISKFLFTEEPLLVVTHIPSERRNHTSWPMSFDSYKVFAVHRQQVNSR